MFPTKVLVVMAAGLTAAACSSTTTTYERPAAYRISSSEQACRDYGFVAGTDAYNLGLSERRANAVKTDLAGRSIAGKRMNPVGYGESRPIADNNTEEGREENRRVELKVIE